jgi:hypothetical protein
LAALALVFNIYAQGASEEGPVIKFEEETIDYGTIKRYADGHREFKFTNTGNAPLVINNCAGTCGCTVPNCPKEPIQPGESASIKVKYATDRIGQFNKGIKVYSNASPADQPIMIHIKGNVLSEEDPSHAKQEVPQVEPVQKAEPVQPVTPHDHPH